LGRRMHEDAYVQELGDDGGRGYLDEDDVVEADAIERVEQREATLDLMRFDHALEDVLDSDTLALACQVVRDGEDGTKIVGRVAPFSNKGVIDISARVGARERQRVIIHVHSAARKQSLKSSQRMMVPILNAPRIGSSW
jgi:hypothetical protein